ncbi:MAG: hypothetical protein ABEK04_05410, partial [Candidatus Nanohalobium sp.]
MRRQNKTKSIVAGEEVKSVFNLTKRDSPITNSSTVDIRIKSEDREFDVPEQYSVEGLWKSTYAAPNLEDGVNHTFSYVVSSSAFRSKLSDTREVNYKDVTPPRFINLTGEPVKRGDNSTIQVTVEDNSNLLNGVTANIIGPEGSSAQMELDAVGSKRLSNAESKKWKAEFNGTTEKGLYNVTVKATDTAGNTGNSGNEYFRVFQPLNISGDAGEPANSTEIRLIDKAGDVAETVNPEGDKYNETIKSGTYSSAEIEITQDKVASLESLSASKINKSPPRFDSRINDNLVNVEKQYLSGFGIVSKTFDNVSGELSFDYSDELSSIEYQGNLQVMKCENYNISKATPCQSGYETLSKNSTYINAETGNLYVNDISGFSSYLLVEDESSSTSTNLNVNLTGQLGNLSDLSNLDSLLQQVASNTQNLGGGGSTAT